MTSQSEGPLGGGADAEVDETNRTTGYPVDASPDIPWAKIARSVAAMPLSPLALRVLIVFSSYANRDRFAWPSQDAVLNDLSVIKRVDRRNLRRAIGELVGVGLLRPAGRKGWRGGGWTNRYLVTPFVGAPVTPTDDSVGAPATPTGDLVGAPATPSNEDRRGDVDQGPLVGAPATPTNTVHDFLDGAFSEPWMALDPTRRWRSTGAINREQTNVPYEQTNPSPSEKNQTSEQAPDPEPSAKEEPTPPDPWDRALDQLLAVGVDPDQASLELARARAADQEPWTVTRRFVVAHLRGDAVMKPSVEMPAVAEKAEKAEEVRRTQSGSLGSGAFSASTASSAPQSHGPVPKVQPTVDDLLMVAEAMGYPFVQVPDGEREVTVGGGSDGWSSFALRASPEQRAAAMAALERLEATQVTR